MSSGKKRNGDRSALWILAVGVLAAAIAGWTAFVGFRHVLPQHSSNIPGPIGGPDIAQDVNTMLGHRARGFSLPDGENKTHTLTPGQGKTIVVISHMGLN